MAKAQPIPMGKEGLIPHIICTPCSDALDFYQKAVGAEDIQKMPGPDGRLMHASMRIGKSYVFLADDFPEYCGGKANAPTALGGTPFNFHLYVADCDAAIKRAVAAGATVEMPAEDMFWGDRYGIVRDPFGHKWAFATHIKDMTPAEMMEASKAMFAQA
jgi:PhnB protein